MRVIVVSTTVVTPPSVVSVRLGMVFVTEHGEPDEELLGILTAWDMAAFF